MTEADRPHREDPMGRSTAPPNPDLLTVPEAAEYLRISRNLAYNLVKRGILPHINLTERTIRVPRHALELWIERQATGQPAGGDVLSSPQFTEGGVPWPSGSGARKSGK